MKKVAVFTSGGDAPGMNAGIRAAVRTAIYHGAEVMGIVRGYKGMMAGDFMPLDSRAVSNIIQRGGTILKSARSEKFKTALGRQQAAGQLRKYGIEGMVAIGGNGTFAGAEVFFKEFGIPTIGIPGTIDNDLYGTDQTVGFDTAVNTALDAVDKIRDTADSHDRVFFIEVMGRDAGYIAIQTGIGTGAEMVMVPENPDSMESVIETLHTDRSRSKTSAIIVVAEGEELGSAHFIAMKAKEKLPHLDIRVTTLGHVQRGGAPTAADRILASRLGLGAVEALLEGKTNVMVGIVNNKLTYTPFSEAINRKKRFNKDLIRMVNILSI